MQKTSGHVLPRASLRAWILAIRPKTLFTGIAPILVGACLGADALGLKVTALSLSRFILVLGCLSVIMLLQCGANLVNDVKDFEKCIDTPSRKGPVRVTQSGLLSKESVKRGYWFCFATATIIGLVISSNTHIGLAAIGLLCVLIAYWYSAGSYPLSHLGLGEVVAFLFFGPVAVLGTAFVVSEQLRFEDFFWSMPLGFFSSAMMAVNNARDFAEDQLANKKTLAVRLGMPTALKVPPLLMVSGLVWFAAYAVLLEGLTPQLMGLLIILLAMLSHGVLHHLWPIGTSYNLALKNISLYSLLYAVMFWFWHNASRF